jgi:hypothetical protein
VPLALAEHRVARTSAGRRQALKLFQWQRSHAVTSARRHGRRTSVCICVHLWFRLVVSHVAGHAAQPSGGSMCTVMCPSSGMRADAPLDFFGHHAGVDQRDVARMGAVQQAV